MRTYTIRAVDPQAGEISVDFVVHPGGIAAGLGTFGPGWLRGRIQHPHRTLRTARGRHLADRCWPTPPACRQRPGCWRARRPGVRTSAILEVSGSDHRTGAGARARNAGASGYTAATEIRPADWPRSCASWNCPRGPATSGLPAKRKVTREARKHLRKELRLPVSHFKVVGYWTDKAEEWNERYEALGEDFKKWLEELWSTDRDPEIIQDEVADVFDANGL